MRHLVLLLLVGSSFGCNPVYSLQPIGEKARSLVADKAEWEGTWIHDEGAVTIAVTDAEHGKLVIAWFEKINERLEPRSYEVELRSVGKWTFASVKDPDKKPMRYVFARVEKKERQLLLSAPNLDAWQAMVKTKKLPGTLTVTKTETGSSSEITVGTLGAKELAFITSEERAALFDRPSPMLKLTK